MIIAFALFAGTHTASAQQGKTTAKKECCASKTNCTPEEKAKCMADASCSPADKAKCAATKVAAAPKKSTKKA